jgi:hypothetical protein
VLLYLQREKIAAIMRVKRALEIHRMADKEDIMKEAELEEGEYEQEKQLYEELRASEEEVTIEEIAKRERGSSRRIPIVMERSASLESEHERRDSRRPSMRPSAILQRAQLALAKDGDEVSPLLLAMTHLFEKYEPHAYWYGVFLIFVRLLETSVLVFFHKRSTKATFATLVAVLSLSVLQKYQPWLKDSDDLVAQVATWNLFFWLFALQAHDALSAVHDLVWGVPLVLSALYLVYYTIKMCAADIQELESRIAAEKAKSDAQGKGEEEGEEVVSDDNEEGEEKATESTEVELTPVAAAVEGHHDDNLAPDQGCFQLTAEC